MTANLTLRYVMRKELKKVSDDFLKKLQIGEEKTIYTHVHMDMENGEDLIGYQFLHGTNRTVGDFEYYGSVKKLSSCELNYELTYIWNDIIDPNFIYDSDSEKAKTAKKIPFSTRKNYTMNIYWDSKPKYINSDKWMQRSKKWPFEGSSE